MKVTVLKEFTAYPNGLKTTYKVGENEIPKSLVEGSKLIEKGLVKKGE